jgi:hypothetical protein
MTLNRTFLRGLVFLPLLALGAIVCRYHLDIIHFAVFLWNFNGNLIKSLLSRAIN